MKIGVFDSGLGGLLITKALRAAMPDYDLVYLGDTLHVPYGRRSAETVFQLTKNAMDYLFREQDCHLIILACNTASASALRRLQQTYLAEHFPNRRILGVVIPTLEHAIDLGHTNIGLIATENMVDSGIYDDELRKINPAINLRSVATPLLVPMIENNGMRYIEPILNDNLAPFKTTKIQSLILGCTHYPRLAPLIKKILGEDVHLISQMDILPPSLIDYLTRHPEHDAQLSKNATTQFFVTDLTPGYAESACEAYEGNVELRVASYEPL